MEFLIKFRYAILGLGVISFLLPFWDRCEENLWGIEVCRDFWPDQFWILAAICFMAFGIAFYQNQQNNSIIKTDYSSSKKKKPSENPKTKFPIGPDGKPDYSSLKKEDE